MEDISRPMEVNEVDLGDDTTTHSITHGAAGSGNAPVQPVTVDTPPFDPPTVSITGPTDSHTVGSVPTPGDVSTGTSVFGKKQRQKTSKVWDDFSQVEVLGVKKSQCN
jgi:hypothetical protein